MVVLKLVLVILGIALFGSAGALVVYDVVVAAQLRRLLRSAESTEGAQSATALVPRPFGPVRWQRALQLAGLGVVPLEAAVLKQNPMLIQKIIAERLSDKLQIMMVPVDGKNFFANDVFRSALNGTGNGSGVAEEDAQGDSQQAGLTAQKRGGRKP
ncbi:MAG TPA: hypothetical protein VKD70_04665 [Candidatus Acidoferrum sp.]|nr:hypothetical protein [Candidatus Acidoferrum sp.]